MAAGVPPPPLSSPTGSYYWLEWYSSLTNFLNGQNIPWSNINFTGSNIADIAVRNHNALTNIQGGNASGTVTSSGNAYHLMGYGFCSADGSSAKVPTGWSVAHTSTGTYTVTHNLALTLPDYMAGATAHSPNTLVTYVDTSNSNSIIVHVGSTTAVNTLTDSGISFWIGRL